eukprot:1686748-Rhodomonas_salina.1
MVADGFPQVRRARYDFQDMLHGIPTANSSYVTTRTTAVPARLQLDDAGFSPNVTVKTRARRPVQNSDPVFRGDRTTLVPGQLHPNTGKSGTVHLRAHQPRVRARDPCCGTERSRVWRTSFEGLRYPYPGTNCGDTQGRTGVHHKRQNVVFKSFAAPRSSPLSLPDMHTRSSILLLVLACGLAVTSATVMDTINGSSTHSRLENLIDAAGLRDTLAGSTNYTVFAPTDNAFGNLSESTLTCLQRQENQGLLADLLKYHVVAGWVTSSMLTDGQTINSIASTKWFTNNTFTFAAAGLTLTAGSSTETSRVDPGMIDLRSGNGVVHSINHPLIPAGFYCPESVVDVVVNSQVHNRLESLVAVAGLAQTLSTA